jgi:hypothetical protein
MGNADCVPNLTNVTHKAFKMRCVDGWRSLFRLAEVSGINVRYQSTAATGKSS